MKPFFLVALILAGCGQTIPPATPAPAPVPPGGTAMGNCGAVTTQFPFSRTPIQGTFSSSAGSKIELTLGYNNFESGYSQVQSLIGSALLNLPDLQYLYSNQLPSGQMAMTQFCVSSASQNGTTPGMYAVADQSIAITLVGTVQVPIYSYSPFYPTPYNNGQPLQTAQSTVTVSIGQPQGCNAWIANGRLIGCVGIQIGQTNSIYYQSR